MADTKFRYGEFWVDISDEESVADGYFMWLWELVGGNYPEYSDKSTLFYILCNLNFRLCLDEDENRLVDGYDYRYFYSEDVGIPYRFINEKLQFPSTICEVLLGLASRCNEIAGDVSKGDRTADFFWRLVKNLGLMCYTNDYFNQTNWGRIVEEEAYEIVKICDIWMDRQFKFDGKGSPFPLKNPPGDERNTNLWYQMQAWIMENFPV